MNAVIRSSLTTSLLRYSRSWGLWLLLLVAPVGARYMIPRGDGSGTVIAIGDRLPEMTAPFLGVSLGIIVSTLLLPIGWMYLRSNTNRRQPWQVEEVTAASRIAIALGRWAADAAVLLGMLTALTLAGWILAFVIPITGPRNLAQLTLALWLVAAPALLGLAALRILFDAIPFTRGGWGDFGYFIFWMGSLIAPAINEDQPAGFAANMHDFAGFLRPLQYGAPPGTNSFAIGGIDTLPGHVSLDVMAGLFSPGYIPSRLVWVLIAIAVAALAGMLYRPHRATSRIIVPGRLRRWLDGGAPPPAVFAAPPAPRAAAPLLGLLAAEFRLIGAGRLFKLLAVIVAIAAATQDFRHAASPAALLLLVFALTAHAARSEARGLLLLTNTAPISHWLRRAAFIIAGTGWSLLLTLPALLTTPAVLVLQYSIVTGAIIAILSIVLAAISRSAFAARMVLLILWYGYLSS
ncbi:hypothetical protein GCM10011529_15480 [Polymorphobacter glacialis]|uniref:Uncharacterized protein n=1 Tax=Sandarakinorhabdus glacialis TaxID=1614636 RepID=A0A916ZRX9_9SPHN|nr:hypothetical protein [Polymorphobacter glacialis]GGE10029.1 hypothetical protein GCM10011529_15480 [Polymorphobacter glacialis]